MATDFTELLDSTAEEIYEDWLAYIQTRDPLLRDTSIYTFNAVLAEAVASQFWIFIQLLKQKIEDSSILTATGTALSSLVLDKLPDGRYPGTKATGTVSFSRASAAPADITVPSGTRIASKDETGTLIHFVTTAECTIDEGQTVAYATAESVEIGESNNVSEGTITFILSAVVGVSTVANAAPFTGGTDGESDDDLRERYLYTIWLPGKATIPMLTEHIDAVEGTREVKVETLGEGDVLIVIDSEEDIDDDLLVAIYGDLAAGCTAPGVLGATLRAAGHTYQIGDCCGAEVWGRCREYVATETVLAFVYHDTDGTGQNGTITIPAGSPRGHAVQAVLGGELAEYIQSSSYAGSLEFDLFMGNGTYPWCYVGPELQEADVTLTIVLTSTPETDLLDNIEASLEAALGGYGIGDQLEFADLVKWIYIDYDTGRAFSGIDDVSTFSIVCKEETLSAFGDSVEIDSDERVMAGTVSVTEA